MSNGECGSIGYGIATAYAKEGANLVLTGRNVQKLTDAKEELEKSTVSRYFPYRQMSVPAQTMKRSYRMW